jgi:hypothetical protein
VERHDAELEREARHRRTPAEHEERVVASDALDRAATCFATSVIVSVPVAP